MATETITLVAGYHAATPVHKIARAAGLDYRFAVIFDALGGEVNLAFYRDVVSGIGRSIDHETLAIELGGTNYESWQELNSFYDHADEDDREPPLRVRFEQRGRLVGLMETEFWMFVGGPPPYSDSCTAAFYTVGDREVLFDRACQQACKLREGREIAARIRAMPFPDTPD